MEGLGGNSAPAFVARELKDRSFMDTSSDAQPWIVEPGNCLVPRKSEGTSTFNVDNDTAPFNRSKVRQPIKREIPGARRPSKPVSPGEPWKHPVLKEDLVPGVTMPRLSDEGQYEYDTSVGRVDLVVGHAEPDAASVLRAVQYVGHVPPNVRHERQTTAGEACRWLSARWRG